MRNFLTTNNFNTFDIFDDMMNAFFKPTTFSGRAMQMRADIEENEKEYALSVDLPGFDKKDIELSLDNGYLTISAKKEEKEEGKNYIRRERCLTSSRTFYVGEVVSEEDIKAKFNNGTLTLNIPKLERKELPKKTIEIE